MRGGLDLIKGGLLIGTSVFLTLLILQGKKAPRGVEVDVAKLLQHHAVSLGRQGLSDAALQDKVQQVMPRLRSVATDLAQRHRIVIFVKGTTLSPLPDWTGLLAKALEEQG